MKSVTVPKAEVFCLELAKTLNFYSRKTELFRFFSSNAHSGTSTVYGQALHLEESEKAVFWESLVRLQPVVYTVYLEALYYR